MNARLKKVPKFRTEAAERAFWATHDSTAYVDWTQAEVVRLTRLKPSTETISLRLPSTCSTAYGSRPTPETCRTSR